MDRTAALCLVALLLLFALLLPLAHTSSRVQTLDVLDSWGGREVGGP